MTKKNYSADMTKKIEVKWSVKPTIPEGIIVGCNRNQEWLLPWWWVNFSLHNSYPITFVNFGDMSETAIRWCQNRGNLIDFVLKDDSFIALKEQISPDLVKIWDKHNPDIWDCRRVWFQKTLVLLQTPYQKTVWIDLDCQVIKPIQQIFDEFLEDSETAIVHEPDMYDEQKREIGILLEDEKMVNAGVLAYRHGAAVILEWAKQIIEKNHLFFSDQYLLARILYLQPSLSVMYISDYYNWFVADGINPKATILHWWGPANKYMLQEEIKYLSKHFLIDLYMK